MATADICKYSIFELTLFLQMSLLLVCGLLYEINYLPVMVYFRLLEQVDYEEIFLLVRKVLKDYDGLGEWRI